MNNLHESMQRLTGLDESSLYIIVILICAFIFAIFFVYETVERENKARRDEELREREVRALETLAQKATSQKTENK